MTPELDEMVERIGRRMFWTFLLVNIATILVTTMLSYVAARLGWV